MLCKAKHPSRAVGRCCVRPDDGTHRQSCASPSRGRGTAGAADCRRVRTAFRMCRTRGRRDAALSSAPSRGNTKRPLWCASSLSAPSLLSPLPSPDALTSRTITSHSTRSAGGALPPGATNHTGSTTRVGTCSVGAPGGTWRRHLRPALPHARHLLAVQARRGVVRRSSGGYRLITVREGGRLSGRPHVRLCEWRVGAQGYVGHHGVLFSGRHDD